MDWAALPTVVRISAAHALRRLDAFDDQTTLDTRTGCFTKKLFVGLHPNHDPSFYQRTLREQGGYETFVRTNPRRRLDVECRNCGQASRTCTRCGEPLVHYPEKGVDVAVSTDMLLHAAGHVDGHPTQVAILCSGDTDFVPAVTAAQRLGLVVVVASWNRQANELFQVADAVVRLDDLIDRLTFHAGSRRQ